MERLLHQNDLVVKDDAAGYVASMWRVLGYSDRGVVQLEPLHGPAETRFERWRTEGDLPHNYRLIPGGAADVGELPAHLFAVPPWRQRPYGRWIPEASFSHMAGVAVPGCPYCGALVHRPHATNDEEPEWCWRCDMPLVEYDDDVVPRGEPVGAAQSLAQSCLEPPPFEYTFRPGNPPPFIDFEMKLAPGRHPPSRLAAARKRARQ